MTRPAFDLSTYFVTDAALCAERGVVWTIGEAIAGGATMVQIRDKTASDLELVAVTRAALAIARPTATPVIVNDRLEVAIAAGADGAHLGQSDGDPSEARARLGEKALIGLSIERHAQLAAAHADSVDYFGVGPVKATTTKQDHADPIGFDGLTAIARDAARPVVAIGGLSASDAARAIQCGAAGLAVVSAICASPDPRRATAELVAAIAAARADMRKA